MTGLILLPTDRLPSPHPEAPPWRGPGRDTALCGRFRDACCGAGCGCGGRSRGASTLSSRAGTGSDCGGRSGSFAQMRR